MWQFYICFPHRSTAAVEKKFAYGSCHTITNHTSSIIALCCTSLLMSLLLASEESVFELASPRQLFSPSSYPLDLSGLGNPTGSNTSAGLAIKNEWNSHALPPRHGGDTIGAD